MPGGNGSVSASQASTRAGGARHLSSKAVRSERISVI